jgi:hypothetical protein
MIDFNQPETATTAGGELVASTSALVSRLAGPPAIVTVAEAEAAVTDRHELGAAIKTVEAFFAPLKSLAHQLHKGLCDRESAILRPLQRLDDEKRRALGDFKAAQDRARRERERALVEAQRQEREAAAVAEAGILERAGEHAIAAAVVNEAIAAPAPVVVLLDVTKTIADLKFRRVWKWRYVGDDPARALALLPREYLTADERKISAHATSMKASASIPGIEFYCDDLPVR